MAEFMFVTQSSHKVREAERLLGAKLEQASLDLPEIQAVELEDVISHKAEYAFREVGGRPVMVEDTGLHIEAWNGLPGALIKWFMGTVGVAGMCKMLQVYTNRNAVARTLVATYDADGRLSVFGGSVKGRISATPCGTRGFGWDPIFVPEGATKTFAEMSGREKDGYSMRRMALEDMAANRARGVAPRPMESG